MTVGRMTYMTAVFTGLAWLTWATGEWVAVYYFLLWVLPIFTTFSFFMMLRQLVQHGNGGRGWLTNTRVFLVQRFIRFSVFPDRSGLPPTAPPVRDGAALSAARAARNAARLTTDYRTQAVVVEGYFLPPHGPPHGPRCSTCWVRITFRVIPPTSIIDNSVLDGVRVDEKAEILREGEAAVNGAGNPAGPLPSCDASLHVIPATADRTT